MDIRKMTGIYGIYVNDELVYIGKTSKSFGVRFNQHKYHLAKGDSKMYSELKMLKTGGNRIYLQPLVIRELMKTDRMITDAELDLMEIALISEHNPRMNTYGVTERYHLGD